MTWFKVDDSFSEHPKLEVLEGDPVRFMAAITVWTLMGSDCARRLTDGHVSRARLTKVLASFGKHALRGADALVECGLWEVADDGWIFHDWAEYQPMRSDVEDTRRVKSERQKRWREGKRAAPAHESKEETAHLDALQARREMNYTPERETLPRPDPSRPDPSRPDPSRPVPINSLSLAPCARALEEFGDPFTAERMRSVFQREYLNRRGVDPSMGGKNVNDFHARVRATAKARGKGPEQLFTDALARWLSRELSQVERRAPYACFAQAWGELADPTKPVRDVRRGYVEAAPEEAFDGPEVDPRELFGLAPKSQKAEAHV